MLILDTYDIDNLFNKKCQCFGTGATLVATSVAAGYIGATMISSMTAKPPQQQQGSQQSAFDNAAINTARKAADTSSSSSIKIAQAAARKSGAPKSNTLLSGSDGVSDEDLNLGNGNLLGGGS
jgi:hypothetical protein